MVFIRAGQGSADNWEGYPVREVDRPPLPPAKGMESLVSLWSLSATQAFSRDGALEDIEGDYNLARMDMRIAYGLADIWEIYAGLPYVTGEIGETSGGSLGNPYAGTRVRLSTNDNFHVALGVGVGLPFGDSDYHYEILGEDLRLQNLRAADPGYNYYPELEARYNAEEVSVRFTARWIFTGEDEVEFEQVGGISTGNVDADPGDGHVLEAGLYYQAADRWVPGLFIEFGSISETEIEGVGLKDEMIWYEASPRLIYQHSQEFEVLAGLNYVFMGENKPAGLPVTLEFKSRF
jgi:hypothetical protein